MQAPTLVSTLSGRFSALSLRTTSRVVGPTTLRSFATAKAAEPSKKSKNTKGSSPKAKGELAVFSVAELKCPIKRPATSFVNFMCSLRDDKTVPVVETAKSAASAWKLLSAEEKAKWAPTLEQREEQQRKREEWENSLSPEQRRARRHYLKSLKSGVKLTPNGYAFFLKDVSERLAQEKNEQRPGGGQHAMMVAGREWRLLSEEKKQEYRDRQKAENEKKASANEAAPVVPRRRLFTAKGPKHH